ncbi:MAG: Txe/YoeB family addiction module toxin [Desulfovibrionaceae bacterium]
MLVWHDTAWADYLYWQRQDKKILKRINMLIKDIERNGNEGIGKPEPLKENLTGFWSRRNDERHSLVYSLLDNGDIQIAQCKGHYNDE